MKDALSPDGESLAEFDVYSEIGMGGPELGHLRVNGENVGVRTAIRNWIWSEDSRFVAFVQFIGRAPDTACLRIYDVRGKRLLKFRRSIGFAPIFKSFRKGVIEFHTKRQAVRVPSLEADGGGDRHDSRRGR